MIMALFIGLFQEETFKALSDRMWVREKPYLLTNSLVGEKLLSDRKLSPATCWLKLFIRKIQIM